MTNWYFYQLKRHQIDTAVDDAGVDWNTPTPRKPFSGPVATGAFLFVTVYWPISFAKLGTGIAEPGYKQYRQRDQGPPLWLKSYNSSVRSTFSMRTRSSFSGERTIKPLLPFMIADSHVSSAKR
jgi:hypothetical protein